MSADFTPLEQELSDLWKEILPHASFGRHDKFIDVGGKPENGSLLLQRLEKRFGTILYMPWLLAAPTLAEQAAWFERKVLNPQAQAVPSEPIDMAAWRQRWQQTFEGPAPRPAALKNPPAAFILSPARAGSTLLRIMLASHPDLFVPPELELLLFNDMQERRKSLHDGWFDLMGLDTAVRELWGCEPAEGTAIVARFLEQNLSTRSVYKLLQGKLGKRWLVDKSPSYAGSLSCLQRGEAWFEGARYIHLIRHPLASIRSWKDSNFDQIVHTPPTETAEAAWLFSHENILKLFQSISPERQLRVHYEKLVVDPETETRRICEFLGVSYDPSVLNPYEGNRMTETLNGVTAGDKNFYRRTSIDPKSALSSRRMPGDWPLAPETVKMAESFGYTDL